MAICRAEGMVQQFSLRAWVQGFLMHWTVSIEHQGDALRPAQGLHETPRLTHC